MDDIEPITCTTTPFGLDDKIFYVNDEDGNQIGGPYSYNDWMKMVTDISGVNPDLMGVSNENDLLNKVQKFKQIIDAQQNDYKNKVIAHQESQDLIIKIDEKLKNEKI